MASIPIKLFQGGRVPWVPKVKVNRALRYGQDGESSFGKFDGGEQCSSRVVGLISAGQGNTHTTPRAARFALAYMKAAA